MGKRLCAAMTRAGTRVIAADRMKYMPSTIQAVADTSIGSVDVRDKEALKQLFRDYADETTTVWNLASPLSVETAMSPELAEAVVIGGMRNVLDAMKEVGCRRICFTDSIGSFGSTSPREDVSGHWLVENPTQDPGSDYGKQKRATRELLDEFRQRDGGDPRIAVLPGVLHSEYAPHSVDPIRRAHDAPTTALRPRHTTPTDTMDAHAVQMRRPVWGNGTTEYALDAMLAAARGESFACPIDPDVVLPMVFVDDLMRGLLALQYANEDELLEPQRIYNIPGLSFSARQLFEEIKVFKPDFEVTHGPLDPNMDKFAKLWPDTLSAEETARDLEYEAGVKLPAVVASVLNAHSARQLTTRAAFRSIDSCSSGQVNDYMLASYVRKYLLRGRERAAGKTGARKEMIADITKDLMLAMDLDKDGIVSIEDFMAWGRINNLESLVDDYAAEKLRQMGVP